MNIFFKAAAGILAALVVWLCISKYNKDISVIISLAVCAMVILSAMTFIRPIIDFLRKLQNTGNLDRELISVVLKVVGIAIIGELCTLVCKDAGNESMGKALQFLSASVAIWMAIPVFEKLLSLLDGILGSI